MAKQKLPSKLYVFREDGGNETWLQAEEKLRECASLEEKRVVGVYQLVETRTLETQVVSVKQGK